MTTAVSGGSGSRATVSLRRSTEEKKRRYC